MLIELIIRVKVVNDKRFKYIFFKKFNNLLIIMLSTRSKVLYKISSKCSKYAGKGAFTSKYFWVSGCIKPSTYA